MSEPVRLAKRVVALTRCSRREAEQYIEGGWVTVDGGSSNVSAVFPGPEAPTATKSTLYFGTYPFG